MKSTHQRKHEEHPPTIVINDQTLYIPVDHTKAFQYLEGGWSYVASEAPLTIKHIKALAPDRLRQCCAEAFTCWMLEAMRLANKAAAISYGHIRPGPDAMLLVRKAEECRQWAKNWAMTEDSFKNLLYN